MDLPSRNEFVKSRGINHTYLNVEEWSEPKFKCPKCGGNVRKNRLVGLCLATYPPTYKSLYKCDGCDYEEYILD